MYQFTLNIGQHDEILRKITMIQTSEYIKCHIYRHTQYIHVLNYILNTATML